MVRYYCSGYDVNDAFGHGLADMLKTELKKEHQTAEGKSLTTMAENEEYTMRLAQSDFVVSFYDSFRYKQFSCVLCE